MNRFLLLLLLLFSFSVCAQQSQIEDRDGLKETCEISGGTWTESGSNWACCWADWGCYGCVSSQCKIKCYTEKCKDANKINQSSSDKPKLIKVKGLAPKGMKAPIVPKPKKVKKKVSHSYGRDK